MYKKVFQVFEVFTHTKSNESDSKTMQPTWCASEVTAGSGGSYTENISYPNRHSVSCKK